MKNDSTFIPILLSSITRTERMLVSYNQEEQQFVGEILLRHFFLPKMQAFLDKIGDVEVEDNGFTPKKTIKIVDCQAKDVKKYKIQRRASVNHDKFQKCYNILQYFMIYNSNFQLNYIPLSILKMQFILCCISVYLNKYLFHKEYFWFLSWCLVRALCCPSSRKDCKTVQFKDMYLIIPRVQDIRWMVRVSKSD